MSHGVRSEPDRERERALPRGQPRAPRAADFESSVSSLSSEGVNRCEKRAHAMSHVRVKKAPSCLGARAETHSALRQTLLYGVTLTRDTRYYNGYPKGLTYISEPLDARQIRAALCILWSGMHIDDKDRICNQKHTSRPRKDSRHTQHKGEGGAGMQRRNPPYRAEALTKRAPWCDGGGAVEHIERVASPDALQTPHYTQPRRRHPSPTASIAAAALAPPPDPRPPPRQSTPSTSVGRTCLLRIPTPRLNPQCEMM